MPTHDLDLLILENPWFPIQKSPRQTSVLGYFEALERLHKNFNVHYATFMRDESFKDSFTYLIDRNTNRKIAYIAAHGSNTSIGSADILGVCHTINQLCRNRHLEGVIFGSCHIASEAKAINQLITGSTVRWCFGYNKSVKWIPSTLVDICLVENLIKPIPDFTNPNNFLKRLITALSLFSPTFQIGTDGHSKKTKSLKNSIELYFQPNLQGSQVSNITNTLKLGLGWE